MDELKFRLLLPKLSNGSISSPLFDNQDGQMDMKMDNFIHMNLYKKTGQGDEAKMSPDVKEKNHKMEDIKPFLDLDVSDVSPSPLIVGEKENSLKELVRLNCNPVVITGATNADAPPFLTSPDLFNSTSRVTRGARRPLSLSQRGGCGGAPASRR